MHRDSVKIKITQDHVGTTIKIMRKGVRSKKKIIHGVLQFLCGIVLGHTCFAFYKDFISDNSKISFHHPDITSIDKGPTNSISNSYRPLSSSGFERRNAFSKGGVKDDQGQNENIAKGTKNMVDATYSENFGTLTNKHDLLLVGVLTSNNFLKTRACTVYNTWAKHIHGTVIFYAEQKDGQETSNQDDEIFEDCDIPLVRLQGVTNAYPPQMKSFLMLRHMAVHYSKKYKWFLRADDDVFVNFNTVHEFLQSIDTVDTNKLFYIGQGGTGNPKSNSQLGLDINNSQYYCMGGPGVLFDRLTLLRLNKYIKGCLKALQTNHEDVEVGRCVLKKLNISCTNNMEMKDYFKHFYQHNSHDWKTVTTECEFSLFSKSITMHPFKSAKEMIHVYNCALKYQRHIQNHKISEVISEIKEIQGKLEQVSGDRRPNIDENTDEVVLWDTFENNKKYGDCYAGRVTPKTLTTHWNKTLRYLTGMVEQDLSRDSYDKGRKTKYQGFNYGYVKLIEIKQGTNYVLDLNLTNIQIKNRTESNVQKQVHLKQQFLPLRVHPLIASVNKRFDTKLNVILPLYKKLTRFETFLMNYERNFLGLYSDATYLNMHLIVVVFAPYNKWGQWFVNESDNLFVQDVDRKLNALRDRYPKEFSFSITSPIHQPFSRANGLNYAAKVLCKNPNELMFFVDVDIFFNLEAVNTIRFLVNQGKTVYFPIVYSTFGNSKYHDKIHPDEEERISASYWRNITDFNHVQGYWRTYGYGMVAMYKSDFVGMDLSIRGWGKEDVSLYDNFLRAKPHLNLIRSADPDIIHLNHPVHCDPALPNDQLQMCYASSYSNYRSTVDAALEIEHRNITDW